MDCKIAQDNFLAHSRGEPVPAEVAEHIGECATCARAYRGFVEAGRLLAALEPISVRAGFAASVTAAARADHGVRRRNAFSQMAWAGASAAAVLLFVGAIGYGLVLGGSRPKGVHDEAAAGAPMAKMASVPSAGEAPAGAYRGAAAAKMAPDSSRSEHKALPRPDAEMATLAAEGAPAAESGAWGPGEWPIGSEPGRAERRLTVALEGVSVREAMGLVARHFGTFVEFESTEATLPRVTLVLENVTEEEAVAQVCEAAGLTARRRSDGVYTVSDREGL